MDETINDQNTPENESAYILHIENFDGPLDLLWELLKKSKIDITEISISDITEQYINYLKLMEDLNVRIASEFIRMASDLLYYKSKALLPAGKIEDEYFVPPLPPELIQKLLEYKKYQKSSRDLMQKFNERSDVFLRENNPEDLPDVEEYINVTLFDLLKAFTDVMDSKVDVEQGEIVFDEILVSDRIEYITYLLKTKEVVHFSDLFGKTITRAEIVASFLAVLEMCKSRAIKVMQHKIYGNIRLVKNLLNEQEAE